MLRRWLYPVGVCRSSQIHVSINHVLQPEPLSNYTHFSYLQYFIYFSYLIQLLVLWILNVQV